MSRPEKATKLKQKAFWLAIEIIWLVCLIIDKDSVKS